MGGRERSNTIVTHNAASDHPCPMSGLGAYLIVWEHAQCRRLCAYKVTARAEGLRV